MRKVVILLLIFPVIFLTVSFNRNIKNIEPVEDEITKLIHNMSLQEKVGQLFVIRPDALDTDLSEIEINGMNSKNAVTEINENILKNYKNYPVGGFIIFGKNIDNPEQLKKLNKDLHNLGNFYPLIYVDEEGGSVVRLANKKNFNLPRYSSMQDIGDTDDLKEAYNVGETIGSYLKDYGIDVDFAPVADVNTNKNNPIIGRRSFSDDPYKAGNMAASMLDGLKSQKVFGCFKHYPGHGDTNTDTHKGYTEILKDWNELQKCELIPFNIGIKDQVPFIMTSHISLPKITGDNKPTTLSYEMVTEKLRNEMNYNGIIISDAMAMGAIRNSYSDEESSIDAILAGVDIILMPYDLKAAFDSVYKAVKENRISEKRIDESVYRILSLKVQMKNW